MSLISKDEEIKANLSQMNKVQKDLSDALEAKQHKVEELAQDLQESRFETAKANSAHKEEKSSLKDSLAAKHLEVINVQKELNASKEKCDQLEDQLNEFKWDKEGAMHREKMFIEQMNNHERDNKELQMKLKRARKDLDGMFKTYSRLKSKCKGKLGINAKEAKRRKSVEKRKEQESKEVKMEIKEEKEVKMKIKKEKEDIDYVDN